MPTPIRTARLPPGGDAGAGGFSAYTVLVLSFGTGDRFTLNGADVILHPVTMAGAAVAAYAAFRTRRTEAAGS